MHYKLTKLLVFWFNGKGLQTKVFPPLYGGSYYGYEDIKVSVNGWSFIRVFHSTAPVKRVLIYGSVPNLWINPTEPDFFKKIEERLKI